MRIARAGLIAAGGALTGYGVVLLVTGVSVPDLVVLAVWLAAVVVVHDGVLAPATAALRTAMRRRGRALPRAAMAAIEIGFAVGAVLSLYVLPEIWAASRMPANPTVLAAPYGVRLLVLWTVLIGLVAVAVWIAVRVDRRSRRGRRSEGV